MMRRTNTYSGPPRGTGHLAFPVRRLLEKRGGIVSTSELRAVGVDQTTLELYREYGALQAVRQGWHCEPRIPEFVRLAWRFGGPLACASALEFHQALVSGDLAATTDIPQPLHVCIARGTARVPSPALLAARWNIAMPLAPIIHWSTSAAHSGDRRAVNRAVALRQADRCDARTTLV